MKTTVITKTNKGHRVWIQGIFGATGRSVGQRYNVAYLPDSIHVIFQSDGKRKITAAKGGIIDLEGKRVTQWAKGSTSVAVDIQRAQIIIRRLRS